MLYSGWWNYHILADVIVILQMEHQLWQLMFCFYFVADGITTCLADVIAIMADG